MADVPLGMIREDCLQTRDFSQMANGPPLSPPLPLPPHPPAPLGLGALLGYAISYTIIILPL